MKKIILFLFSQILCAPSIKTHDDLSAIIGFCKGSSGQIECRIKKILNQESTYSIVAAYSENPAYEQAALQNSADQFHIEDTNAYDLTELKETYQHIIDTLPAASNENSHGLIVACVLLSPRNIITTALKPGASAPDIVGHSRPLEYIDQAYFARSTTHTYAQEIEGCITAQETADAMQLKHNTQPFHLVINIKEWKEFCIAHASH